MYLSLLGAEEDSTTLPPEDTVEADENVEEKKEEEDEGKVLFNAKHAGLKFQQKIFSKYFF